MNFPSPKPAHASRPQKLHIRGKTKDSHRPSHHAQALVNRRGHKKAGGSTGKTFDQGSSFRSKEYEGNPHLTFNPTPSTPDTDEEKSPSWHQQSPHHPSTRPHNGTHDSNGKQKQQSAMSAPISNVRPCKPQRPSPRPPKSPLLQ